MLIHDLMYSVKLPLFAFKSILVRFTGLCKQRFNFFPQSGNFVRAIRVLNITKIKKDFKNKNMNLTKAFSNLTSVFSIDSYSSNKLQCLKFKIFFCYHLAGHWFQPLFIYTLISYAFHWRNWLTRKGLQ